MSRFKITQRLAATAVAAAVLAGMAVPTLAQPGGPAPATATAEQAQRPDRGDRPRQRAMTPEQRQQMMAQHMAQRAEAFKQKLQLTPEQEPAWNTLLQSMNPDASARKAWLDMQGMEQLTTPERIDRMRAIRAQRAADMDRRGDAVKAFYTTLTPAQQKIFDAEGARMYGQRGNGMGGHMGGHMGGYMDGHGHGHWHGGKPGMRGQGPAAPAAPASR